MAFLLNPLKNISKALKHYINPNENPTDIDKQAFTLLQNVQVEQFVQFVKQKKVNINVTMFNGLSLLTKAVEISNKHKPGFTKQDIVSKCIIAINFLLDNGINIDHQDKTGRTALLAACHWQQQQIAELLIKHGANLDLQTNQSGWKTNPLIAACFKQNYTIIQILIVNGANIQLAIELNKQANGFRLNEKQISFMRKAQNIKKILRSKKYEELSKTDKKILSRLNEANLYRLIDIC